MNAPLISALVLAEGNGGGGGSPDILLLLMLLILAVFVVMTIRRGRKMRNAQVSAMSGAIPGAEVATAGGMVGTVVSRDEEKQRITLEFSSGHRADFTLGAVQQVLQPAPSTEDPTAGEQTPGEEK